MGKEYLGKNTEAFYQMPTTINHRKAVTPQNILICGCFDLFHNGHILLIKGASQFGNVYVGIGDDESIKDFKGENRPILTELERLQMVTACRYVSQAKIFHFKEDKEKHYEALINWATPIAYAQGPDHAPEVLEGLLEDKGIPVIVIPNKIQGTTNIEQKIKSTLYKSEAVERDENYYFDDP